LLDRQNHHCFQPLLYQVATAALSPADVAWPIRHILRKQQNATVLMAEVTGIDAADRRVLIGAGARVRRIPTSATTNGRPSRRD
jgi:NADH dehydrogenase